MTQPRPYTLTDVERHRALGEAIERVHDPLSCHNNTCELSAALRAKLYLHAAYLCVRASEGLLAEDDPEGILEKFYELCPELGDDPRALEEADRFAEIPVERCPDCDAYVFLNTQQFGPPPRPLRCGNCGHELPGEPDTLDPIMLAIAEDVIRQHGEDR